MSNPVAPATGAQVSSWLGLALHAVAATREPRGTAMLEFGGQIRANLPNVSRRGAGAVERGRLESG